MIESDDLSLFTNVELGFATLDLRVLGRSWHQTAGGHRDLMPSHSASIADNRRLKNTYRPALYLTPEPTPYTTDTRLTVSARQRSVKKHNFTSSNSVRLLDGARACVARTHAQLCDRRRWYVTPWLNDSRLHVASCCCCFCSLTTVLSKDANSALSASIIVHSFTSQFIHLRPSLTDLYVIHNRRTRISG